MKPTLQDRITQAKAAGEWRKLERLSGVSYFVLWRLHKGRVTTPHDLTRLALERGLNRLEAKRLKTPSRAKRPSTRTATRPVERPA